MSQLKSRACIFSLLEAPKRARYTLAMTHLKWNNTVKICIHSSQFIQLLTDIFNHVEGYVQRHIVLGSSGSGNRIVQICFHEHARSLSKSFYRSGEMHQHTTLSLIMLMSACAFQNDIDVNIQHDIKKSQI